MKAHELLEQTAATLKQRGTENGYDRKEERSMDEIVQLFYARTGEELSPSAGWQFMICLKEVRLKRQLENGGDMADTLIDLISYTALMAECLTEKAP